mgnify:CR=1 FL=1|jgi:hypothetical protein
MANPKGIVAMLSKFGTSVTNLSKNFDTLMKSGNSADIINRTARMCL